MTQNATREDVEYKFEFAGSEMRVLVVDGATAELYRTNKVDINLRNVEGKNLIIFHFKFVLIVV